MGQRLLNSKGRSVLRTDVIRNWWVECLERETQLCEDMSDIKGVRVPEKATWYTRIETELLWGDFQLWCISKGYDNDIFCKSGFMLIFYRVSGAKSGRSRIGQTNRRTTTVAKFGPLGEHQKTYGIVHPRATA